MSSSPLSIEITDIAAGWIGTKIHFCEQEFEFPISTVLWSEKFFYLLGVLYYFSPEFADCDNSEIHEYIDEFNCLDDSSGDECELAYRTEFDWFAEPQYFVWNIERELTLNADFKLKIRCTTNYEREMTTIIDTEVPFKEFCFSVVKAVDKSIKRYGFVGMDVGTYKCRDFNLSHFLYLKAYVLDRLDLIETTFDIQTDEVFSSFEKELELLKIPMM